MLRNKYLPYRFVVFMLSSLLCIYIRLARKSIYCQTLSGEGFNKISLNCDMTVTCNCHDMFGLGVLGDLSKDSLIKILTGRKAGMFRSMFRNGRIPIMNCILCAELRITDRGKAMHGIAEYAKNDVLLVAENTPVCNLRCITCKRGLIMSKRKRLYMNSDDVKMLSSTVRKNGIKMLDYYNLGEPFVSKNIKSELSLIRKENPDIEIKISTNGTLVNTTEKMEAAMLSDAMVFSIHGSTQRSAGRYQRGTDFKKAYNNMKGLVKFRNSKGMKKPVIVWKYVMFHWNESEELIKRAIVLARKAGVDSIFFELTLSPLFGIAYKHFLRMGYLDRIAKRNGKFYDVDL